LCTLAAAEQLYDALYRWDSQGYLDVTSISLEFFRDFNSSISVGSFGSSSATYFSLTKAIRNYADGFTTIVQKYTPSDGSLAEQFSKDNGIATSAIHLTWSYVSFLTATSRRSGKVPSSWGSSNARIVPSVCSATSVKGTYAVAPVTPWPTGLASKNSSSDNSTQISTGAGAGKTSSASIARMVAFGGDSRTILFSLCAYLDRLIGSHVRVSLRNIISLLINCIYLHYDSLNVPFP